MLVPVASLTLDPANVRRHNPKNLEAIKGSLARFGQQKPIVVTDKNVVIAGNGTLEAARALGWEKIDVAVTKLKGADATAFAIADNRTAELAEWDNAELQRTLIALQNDDVDVASLGFDESYINGLVKIDKISFDGGNASEKNKLEKYLESETRMMQLTFSNEDFEVLTANLATIMEAHGLQSHSDAIFYVVSECAR